MPPLKPAHGPAPGQWRGQEADAALMAREFPALAGALARPETRRRVLRLMAASAAMSGLAGCGDPSTPDGHYTPAVNQAADIVPGLPNHYATAFADGGAAAGLVVRHDMGRPVKIEGNPAHPGSLGATSIHGQALLLDFYDPDRSCGLLRSGQAATWQALQTEMLGRRAALASDDGAGLRILTGRVVSPTLRAAIEALLGRYQKARWVEWEAAGRGAVQTGLAAAYGQPVSLLARPERADVILALDSDLISGAPGHLAYARGFASRRNPARGKMSRVYAAEPLPTLIGMAADHRHAASPAQLRQAALSLADLVIAGGSGGDAPPWLRAAAADLKQAGSRALVHAGPDLPPETHALLARVNEHLGARGTSFDLLPPLAAHDDARAQSADALLADMQAGRVQALLILDANPAYTLPGFADALGRVPFVLASNAAPDETARAATWFLPATHLFEAWGDLAAHDGTLSIQQPQALPLYNGTSAFGVLALFGDGAPVSSQQVVRDAWRPYLDDPAWQAALAGGVVPGTASAPIDVEPIAATAYAPPPVPAVARPEELSLLIKPDPSLLDGRWANNPWLQELPRPIGHLVWGNPILLAPATAARLGLSNQDEAELTVAGVRVTAPIWTVPGQAPDTVALWLGGGRREAGDVGNHVGTDATPLRGLEGPVSLRRTGHVVRVASTDHHNMLEVDPASVDDIARHITLAEFSAGAGIRHEAGSQTIYDHEPGGAVAWAMSIDLNACIGCNACVTACQAENNIPVVGPEQVLIGREMHWLRIDRYYEGGADAPDMYLQPILCMHCEQAPCEPVCPVEATIHDSEGLNLQVYNRCIGTRFCSNNCPYKVRRFNFGAWAAEEPRQAISRNPDVTVRSRGVMEKCTFCVQRIAASRIAADRDGAAEQVVTACQAACPTQAFTFGDMADPGTEVRARKQSPLTYVLLPEQNTRPRVTYEARVTNRHPGTAAT